MTLQQLELFLFEEQLDNSSHTLKVEEREFEPFPPNTSSGDYSMRLSPQLPTAVLASSDQATIAYQEGDIVRINMPAKEEEPGVFWYLKGYFSHLLEAQGCIKRVLPYENLQYKVEFDTKNPRNTLLLHHKHLQWIR
jgi:hypothetical protein